MLKIIEQAPGQSTDVVLGTQTLPAPSIVEDPDGYRWALLRGPTIPATLWRWLLQRRPDALIAGEHATPFDYARDQQTETEGAHRIPEPVWREWTPGTEYRELRMAMKVERPVEGFVHLHTHSEASALDGLSTIEEIVTAVVRDGNPAVAVTDHGTCVAHPELQLTCDKYGVKPIFGNECYFVDDVKVKDRDYYHLVLWAMNDEGLRNLWALSTASEVDGKHYKPRIDWKMLEQFHEGLLVSTACLRGPVLHPLATSIEDAGREPEDRKWTPERGDPMEVALNNLDRLQGIFGDRLYVELHANQIPVQIQLNHWLVDLARERGLPLVAVVDAHYAEPDHKQDHQVWLRIQTKKELTDNTGLFEGGHDYHMMTRDEVAKSLAYLGSDVVDEAIANTVRVADRCTAKIVAKGHNPIFTRKCKEYPDAESRMERDVERMIDKCLERWDERTQVPGKPAQDLYLDRFKTEAALIVKKGFCFPPGTEVLMADGLLRPIEQVKEGEFVLTRNGAEPVAVNMAREVDEELVQLKVAGSYRRLTGTGNHPVLTSNGFRKMAQIKRGDEVAVDFQQDRNDAPFDLIGLARERGWQVREQAEEGRIGFVRMGPGRWGTERVKRGWAPQRTAPTPELMYLIGLWVAQGHLYDPDGAVNPGQVFWTMHKDDWEVHVKLVAALKVMGLGAPRIYSKVSATAPEHKGVTYAVTNHPLALLLQETVGCGSRTKRLSSWITSLSPDALAPFIDGWVDGDGHLVNGDSRVIVDTANRELAFQLRQMLLASGVWATETTHQNEGRTHYRVIWTPVRLKSPYNARWDGNRWWVKILQVEWEHYIGSVHNLSIAGDPTYIAEGVRVHNCGYFLMVSDFVMHAKENRVWVGPARGSGGGSLVAYLLGITEIDPVQYDLLFARFMTEGRTELPDFDIDFPTSKKQFMLDYVAQRWGVDHISTVGTHTRLQSKGVIKDVARTLKSELPPDAGADIEAVSKIITEAEASTAGLGMSWEDLWVQFGDLLEPYRERYPVVFQFAEKLRGRLKTYGAHAAGVVIDPDAPLTGALPLRMAGEGDDRRMVTQFDMNALTWMGYVKFDMLNLRTLDTLQQAADLVYESTGKWIHPYGWVDELLDPQVYEEISAGWTQGMFQIETSSGIRMCKRFRPESVVELADVITLVRPGPARSGLTDLYLNRKDGLEETYYPDPRMQEALKDRYGCLLYQEDVMATTMILAGYNGDEADKVRKILSKKKVDKVLEEGKKFVSRASENGMDSQAAKDLWEQIAEFAKYSFPQAHATAYAILGVWTGWFKVHYGLQYLTATLSTVKDERIPEFVEETRRIGYRVLPPDINVSGLGFTMDVASMAVRYGLASVKGVGDAAVNAILEPRAEAPFVDFDDFLERKGAKCNAGHVKILARIGAFDTLVPNRAGLMGRLEAEKVAATGTDVCAWKGSSKPIVWITKPISAARRDELNAMDEQARAQALSEITARAESPLPCDYPWHSEPDKLGRTHKPEKRKAPPKKCTRGCRQFRPMDLPTVEDYPPFTDADIRKIEMDLLGVFLSSTPFDEIPAEIRAKLHTGVDVLSGDEGSYQLLGYVKSVRKKTDKTGKDYAFVTVDTPQGSIEAIIFSRAFSLYRDMLNPGSMSLMAITKNSRGQNLTNMEALEFEEAGNG